METNNTQKTTVMDVLVDVCQMLKDIKIPISEVEGIGIPVARAINGIQLCIETFKIEAEKQQKPAEENGDNVTVLPTGDQEEISE